MESEPLPYSPGDETEFELSDALRFRRLRLSPSSGNGEDSELAAHGLLDMVIDRSHDVSPGLSLMVQLGLGT